MIGLRHRLSRIIDRLEVRDVRFYCTDEREAYASLLALRKSGHQEQASDRAGIKRNNGRNRQWFKRSRRKSIGVSKAKEMVDLTAWRSWPDFESTAPRLC